MIVYEFLESFLDVFLQNLQRLGISLKLVILIIFTSYLKKLRLSKIAVFDFFYSYYSNFDCLIYYSQN
jgi:hypothetical protein